MVFIAVFDIDQRDSCIAQFVRTVFKELRVTIVDP
jgi:hypothetical protein